MVKTFLLSSLTLTVFWVIIDGIYFFGSFTLLNKASYILLCGTTAAGVAIYESQLKPGTMTSLKNNGWSRFDKLNK